MSPWVRERQTAAGSADPDTDGEMLEGRGERRGERKEHGGPGGILEDPGNVGLGPLILGVGCGQAAAGEREVVRWEELAEVRLDWIGLRYEGAGARQTDGWPTTRGNKGRRKRQDRGNRGNRGNRDNTVQYAVYLYLYDSQETKPEPGPRRSFVQYRVYR